MAAKAGPAVLCCFGAHLLAAVAAAVFLMQAGCDKDGDRVGTVMHGQCGMEGTMVECIVREDCPVRPDIMLIDCTLQGECSYSNLILCEEGTCPPGYHCLNYRICTSECDSHQDCSPDAYCNCRYCELPRCEGTACPPGSDPVPGSLACTLTAFEGECHAVTCPTGYEQVGVRGCVSVR